MKTPLSSFFALISISLVSLYGCSGQPAENGATQQASMVEASEVQHINLWNGSRTPDRIEHEMDVLLAVLDITREEYGEWELSEHTEDYHGDRESRAFREYNHDLFVTVAGNPKLVGERKVVIHEPLMKGILGYRVLIIREEDAAKFAAIQTEAELQQLRAGIPEGWADAALFRHNNYQVVERGTYDDMFEGLHNNEFDYTALGANEIEGVFAERADEVEGLIMVDHLLVYYPFPLLFYVNPESPELAERIQKGMQALRQDGSLENLLHTHNEGLFERLGLTERVVFGLDNPILPEELAGYRSELLD